MKKALILLALSAAVFCGCNKSKCNNGELECSGQCLIPAMAHLASCSVCEAGYCDIDGNLLNGCEGVKESDGKCAPLGLAGKMDAKPEPEKAGDLNVAAQNANAKPATADADEKNEVAKNVPAAVAGSLEVDKEYLDKNHTLVDRGEEVDYVLSENLLVDGYTLTIEPGVTIAIKNGHNIEVLNGGAIQAKGTPEKPIVIRSAGTQPAGSVIFGESANAGIVQSLSHVTFKNLGAYTYSSAAIRVEANVRVAMDHCTIDTAVNDGLWVEGQVVKFENNTIKNCGNFPIQLQNPVVISQLGENNAYSDNKKNLILISSDRRFDESMELTFNKQSIPWFILNSLSFSAETTTKMTIPAGSHFVVNADSYLNFLDKIKLTIAGTSEAPVVFESIGEEPWNGITFAGSELVMSYANILKTAPGNYHYAALTIEGGARAKLDHVTIDGAVSEDSDSGYGIRVTEGKISKFKNNSIKNVSNYPIFLQHFNYASLGDGNVYASNSAKKNFIYVDSGNLNGEVETLKIKSQSVPYYLNGGFSVDDTAVTVEAGTRFAIQEGASFEIRDNASIQFNGTAENHIVMTGYNGNKWERLLICNKKDSAVHFVDLADTADVAFSIENSGDKKVTVEQLNLGGACFEPSENVVLTEGSALKQCAE